MQSNLKTQQVILVDSDDNQLRLTDVLLAHKGGGKLHRAISVLVYRKNLGVCEVLLQQRSKQKLLWPLYWSNSICTHPQPNESLASCGQRRLKEELGIHIDISKLEFLFRLRYQANYDKNYSENEQDSIFAASWDGKLTINPQEVEAVRWVRWHDLIDEAIQQPGQFTPWFVKLLGNIKVQAFFEQV